MALCVDEYYQNSAESSIHESLGWNQLQDIVLFTTFDAFLFIDNSFYFTMLQALINNLIPSGLMNFLVDEYLRKKWNAQKVEKNPKVLSIDDLQFGFKIWFGTCLCACFTFMIEKGIKFRNLKKSKVKVDTSQNLPNKNKQNHWIKVKAAVLNDQKNNRELDSKCSSDEKLKNSEEVEIKLHRKSLVNDQIHRLDHNVMDDIEFVNLELIDNEDE